MSSYISPPQIYAKQATTSQPLTLFHADANSFWSDRICINYHLQQLILNFLVPANQSHSEKNLANPCCKKTPEQKHNKLLLI